MSEELLVNNDNLAVGAKGGAIAFTLKISATALGFLNQIILARILGAGGLGEVILALTVVRIAVWIAKFGMEEAMMKYIPLYIDQKDDVHLKGTISFALRFCLIFSVLIMLLVFFAYKYISINVFHSEGLLKLMPVVVFAIPAWVLRDVISGILRGYKDAFSALIPESIVSPFFRIVIFLVLILSDISPLYAIIAFVSAEVLAVLTSVKFLTDKMKRYRMVRKRCDNKKILDVAYTIIFTSMGVLLYTQADIWILGMYSSTATVGIYSIAAKLVILVYFPMLSFGALIPSLISSIHVEGNIGEMRRMVSESTRWILSMAVPIILILVLEGRFILKYAYGEGFAAGYSALVILTAGQLIKAASGLVGTILQMTGQHKIYMKINIIWGVLNIILNMLLVPRFGMIGAAIATAFCLSMVDISSVYVIFRRLSVMTFARGVLFDIVFIAVVAVFYMLLGYHNLFGGYHVLLIFALAFYLWKSIAHHDIPWRLLITKFDGM